MPDFRLPDLGEGLTEAEIVAWHVEVGDTVLVDQAVVEVETAKATVEVPCPWAGVVGARHGSVGDVVAVGAPLISIATSADSETSGNVLIGYGTPPAPTRRHRGLRRAAVTDRPATPPTPPHVSARPGQSRPATAVSSPLVRRLARAANVDVRTLTGSGPDGLVMRRDVAAAIDARHPAPDTDQSSTTSGRTTSIPLNGVRRATAEKLSRSRREIPEATIWVDVDATGLLAARADLNRADLDRADLDRAGPNRAGTDAPIGITALLARFAVLGLRRFPELNARVEADALVLFADVHLGFAAQTDRGLVVPVIRHADTLSTAQLSRELAARTSAARAGRLRPRELTGGTFTVNNYGVFGVDGSAAIINHPEVGILGIGRLIQRPWVVDGRLEVRDVGQLTLAFDHRACDGATAGGFLRFVADCVEAPIRALRDL